MDTPEIPGASSAAAILSAGIGICEPRHLQGHRAYAMVPDENGAAHLEYLETEQLPDFIRAAPKFDEADSFIEYFKRFHQGNSATFANMDTGSVFSILDYHNGSLAKTDWCRHHATFTAKPSDEWKIWASKSGKQMTQVEFAQMIEDNSIDIVRPDGATMLEVALSIEASKSGAFKSARRLQNGNVDFAYVENTTATAGQKGSLEIPKDFDLRLRPFVGCDRQKVVARLRYRIDDGNLRLWYELVRPEDIRRDAFQTILAKIAEETAVKVYLGNPS